MDPAWVRVGELRVSMVDLAEEVTPEAAEKSSGE
jgi:hypothetical protein